ncbi:tyrosine-protein phosphatase [Rheinheimera sp. 1928-s]|uniref:tyrosine-protein phosphatase n=1 Tax=Rheinheimera sp. 1928-s TaxID=3033803 RepID=UPI00260A166A|nr:tyrosine-protein phosphatase [Rheinheimera sp. 1928-s]MDF3123833.1 tyrosine-protein phosphatase [Rheinheimera sp. 1928-s]
MNSMKITTFAAVLAMSQLVTYSLPLSAAGTQAAVQQSVPAVYLVRQTQSLLPDALMVHWTMPAATVDIYRAETPDKKTMKKIASDVRGNSYLIQSDTQNRPYIYVQPAGQQGHWAAERVLPLQGGVNFRDLGGYPSQSGGTVVWGKLFRSGTMTDLTSADYQYLSALQIRTMCDFRSREELMTEPTLYKNFAPEAQMLVRDYSMQEMMAGSTMQAFGKITTREQAIEVFSGFYRQGPERFSTQFKQMFEQLLAGKVPLAVNCSAGKDRTGMASALILSALNVPRQTIVNDYALSEKVYDFSLREMKKHAKAGDKKDSPHNQFMQAMKPEVIQVMMGTDPALIQAMFDQLEKDYGSVDVYLEQKLGLDQAKLQQLRQMYLEA